MEKTVKEISQICNVSKGNIVYWIHKFNIKTRGIKQIQDKDKWKIPKEKWEDLYKKGLNDYELCERTGASLRTINRWRKENNLPINPKSHPNEIDKSNFLKLYNKGLNDEEIAKIENCHFSTIRRWRKRNNLPTKQKNGYNSDGTLYGKIFKKGHSLNKGNKHWNWKGGVSFENNNEFYWRKEWKEVRDKCYERDNYTCQICRRRGLYFNAHHIMPRRDFPELELELSNLLTICISCHLKIEREYFNEPINSRI